MVSSFEQSSLRNRILARLPDDDFARLAPAMTTLDCPLGEILVQPDGDMSHVYFLEKGIASIVVLTPDGESVEAGVVGREGFVAPIAALGARTTPHRIEMQMRGVVHRITRIDFLAAAGASPPLLNTLLKFVTVMSVQSAYTSLSNAIQTIDQRLARWILMCHDRSDSNDLALTHRFLAVMLAVRRPSVTEAIHLLEGRGLIRAERKYVTVRDRAGLEDYARDAYGKPEAEYRRLLGPL